MTIWISIFKDFQDEESACRVGLCVEMRMRSTSPPRVVEFSANPASGPSVILVSIGPIDEIFVRFRELRSIRTGKGVFDECLSFSTP